MNTAIACTEEKHMNNRMDNTKATTTSIKRRLSKSNDLTTPTPEKRLREDNNNNNKKSSTAATTTKPTVSARPKMITSDRIVRASHSKYRPCKQFFVFLFSFFICYCNYYYTYKMSGELPSKRKKLYYIKIFLIHF